MKSPVDSIDTLGVKYFVEIALSCTVSEINAFLRFTQKFKMAAKNGGENDFWEKLPGKAAYTLQVKKSCRNCSILHPFQDKCVFAFNAEIQDDRQNGGKAIFWKSCQ